MKQTPAPGRSNQPNELALAVSACRSAFSSVAVFSLIINLTMLAPSIYMLQVYDRVLTTGRTETLVLLTAIVVAALALMAILESLRTSVTVRIGGWLNDRLGPVYLTNSIRSRLQGQNIGIQPLNDISQIQNFISNQGLVFFFDSPWVPIFIVLIWLLHPMLGMIALASAVVLLILSLINELANRKATENAGKAQMKANASADAAIRNAEAVWSMGMLPVMISKWQAVNDQALQALRVSGERSGLIVGLTKFVRFTVQIAILGVGAMLVLRSEMTAGGMIAASILLGRALAPVEAAMSNWRNFTSAHLAYKRLKKQLNDMPSMARRTRLPDPEGHIKVENLIYLAPGSQQMILAQINLEVLPGQATAIIGPSGAGKSTLCRFLVGLGEPTAGRITLDGSKLSHWDPVQLGEHIGFLPQDVELFDGTIRENIARMNLADDATVLEAARLAHAHEMIQMLPQGYDTRIGDEGIRLSGGQRQRIGLARAIYGNPKLIVLDEPNANLDQTGEEALAAAVNELKERGTALIIVGHRPSTLAQADRVVVIKDGVIAMNGPREEVLEKMRMNSAEREQCGAEEIKKRRAAANKQDETQRNRQHSIQAVE